MLWLEHLASCPRGNLLANVGDGSKVDVSECPADVRFVPKAESCTAAKRSLFDQLIGELPEIYRNVEAERFGSL